METYESLREEFERKVRALRERCGHRKVSGWVEEWWAPGHSTGFEVKVCEICREVVAKRTGCHRCGTMLEEMEFIYGDEADYRPINEIYCRSCEDEWKKFMEAHPFPREPRTVEVTVYPAEGKPFKKTEPLTKEHHFSEVHTSFRRQKPRS